MVTLQSYSLISSSLGGSRADAKHMAFIGCCPIRRWSPATVHASVKFSMIFEMLAAIPSVPKDIGIVWYFEGGQHISAVLLFKISCWQSVSNSTSHQSVVRSMSLVVQVFLVLLQTFLSGTTAFTPRFTNLAPHRTCFSMNGVTL